jgi:hypothetical protein
MGLNEISILQYVPTFYTIRIWKKKKTIIFDVGITQSFVVDGYGPKHQ